MFEENKHLICLLTMKTECQLNALDLSTPERRAHSKEQSLNIFTHNTSLPFFGITNGIFWEEQVVSIGFKRVRYWDTRGLQKFPRITDTMDMNQNIRKPMYSDVSDTESVEDKTEKASDKISSVSETATQNNPIKENSVNPLLNVQRINNPTNITSIKHKLPIMALPEREKTKALQSNVVHTRDTNVTKGKETGEKKTSVLIQTDHIRIITEEDYRLLEVCKLNNITLEDLKKKVGVEKENVRNTDGEPEIVETIVIADDPVEETPTQGQLAEQYSENFKARIRPLIDILKAIPLPQRGLNAGLYNNHLTQMMMMRTTHIQQQMMNKMNNLMPALQSIGNGNITSSPPMNINNNISAVDRTDNSSSEQVPEETDMLRQYLEQRDAHQSAEVEQVQETEPVGQQTVPDISTVNRPLNGNMSSERVPEENVENRQHLGHNRALQLLLLNQAQQASNAEVQPTNLQKTYHKNHEQPETETQKVGQQTVHDISTVNRPLNGDMSSEEAPEDNTDLRQYLEQSRAHQLLLLNQAQQGSIAEAQSAKPTQKTNHQEKQQEARVGQQTVHTQTSQRAPRGRKPGQPRRQYNKRSVPEVQPANQPNIQPNIQPNMIHEIQMLQNRMPTPAAAQPVMAARSYPAYQQYRDNLHYPANPHVSDQRWHPYRLPMTGQNATNRVDIQTPERQMREMQFQESWLSNYPNSAWSRSMRGAHSSSKHF